MFIADRNVFGVDLNPVAVELAEVSLWLNSIYEGAFVPWFGMQLVCGNSLVGARKQTYSSDLIAAGRKGQALWYDNEPVRVMPGTKRHVDHVYHFLLGHPSMSKYDDKVVKDLAQDHIKTLNTWRTAFTKYLTDAELKTTQELSAQIDDLWKQHCDQLRVVRAKTTDPLTIFDREEDNPDSLTLTEQKDELFRQEGLLAEVTSSSAYCRLKLVMDYWCALWFWPILESKHLPTRSQFLGDVSRILSTTNAELSTLETLLEEYEHLKIVRTLASHYRFMHWELEFADIFEDNDGFDLIIGNPPWIKLEWQEGEVLGDRDPRFVVKKLTAPQAAKLRVETLQKFQMTSEYLSHYESSSATQSFLNARANYPSLQGIQGNSYKCFLSRSFDLAASESGVTALVHPAGIFDDPKGGEFRTFLYERLRYHFRFKNALLLFPIVHQAIFALNVYGGARSPSFEFISNLLHPRTIDQSFECADASGELPGIKDEENNWDLSGHRDRVIRVDMARLALFTRLYDAKGTPATQGRLPVLHGEPLVRVLECLAETPKKLIDLKDDIIPSVLWDETNAQKDGTILRSTDFVAAKEFVFSGPHIHVGNPFRKTPKSTCISKSDYDVIDLTALPDDYLPRTNYKPACPFEEYKRRVPQAWDGTQITDHYRLMARKMLSLPMERTLISTIIPRDVAHTNGCISIAFKHDYELIRMAAQCFSLPFDFFIKSTGKTNLYPETLETFPVLSSEIDALKFVRVLGLTCLTRSYSDLWQSVFSKTWTADQWTSQNPVAAAEYFVGLSGTWSPNCGLRSELLRRQALLELDVLVAMELGLDLNDLKGIYKVQFPVLRQYDSATFYDQAGRIVFTPNKIGLPGVGLARDQWLSVRLMTSGTVEQVVHDTTIQGGPIVRTVTYQAPFFSMNREQDYEGAWKEFSRRRGPNHSLQIHKDEKLSSLI